MKHTLILAFLMVFLLSGCIKKAILLKAGPEAHGSIDVNFLTGGVTIDIDGDYFYCSVPLGTTLEGRSFTEGFEKFCQIEIDQLMAKESNNAMEDR